MAAFPSAGATFRRIFDEHHEAVQAYCLRRLPVDDANEAAVEVFSVVWRRIDDVPSGETTISWLYGVAHNVVRNHRRAARRAVRLLARAAAAKVPAPSEPDQQVIGRLEGLEVRRALETLRPADQELLRLKAWEELSNAEVASLLGVSARAVEGRYARALRRLARALSSSSGTSIERPVSRVAGERGGS